MTDRHVNEIEWAEILRKTTLSVRDFIGGRYVDIGGESIIEKRNPRNGIPIYTLGTGDVQGVNDAVSNARNAYDSGNWKHMSVESRRTILEKLADLLVANRNELALYECLDVGKPISNAFNEDIPYAAAVLREVACAAEGMLSPLGSDGGLISYQLRKPIGVVGGIIGWNFPLVLAAMKVAPALMMGNSVILKPSEFTSLSACRFAELAIEAGVPPGMFNVVHGSGEVTGNAIAHHAGIDLLTFTGSSVTGKQLMIAAGESNMKRLMLECGGKSPYLIFEDFVEDLDLLADNIVGTGFPNQGALCAAATRICIHEKIKPALVARIIEKASALKPSDPLDPATKFGALVNEAHLEKVTSYIESGKKEGARLLYGGARVLEQTGGYYLTPAVFDGVQPDHTIAMEEIFGPVICIFSFRDVDEAIQLANATQYGLSAYVATKDAQRIQKIASEINSGILNVTTTMNSRPGSVRIGAEPHKQSGFGFENGIEGLRAYTASTQVRLLW